MAQPDTWQVLQTYFVIGVEHILAGWDHLLFVIALVLLIGNWRTVVVAATAFTVSHSITLAAAALGYVGLPQAPVEALIALSILFLAGELVKVNRGLPSLTARNPWLVAFAFGLLHGFGFAGALSDIGLPQNEIALALLMFNVGVEIGQLMFVAGILALLWLIQRFRRDWPEWLRLVPAYGIGGIAAFWLIERVAGF